MRHTRFDPYNFLYLFVLQLLLNPEMHVSHLLITFQGLFALHLLFCMRSNKGASTKAIGLLRFACLWLKSLPWQRGLKEIFNKTCLNVGNFLKRRFAFFLEHKLLPPNWDAITILFSKRESLKQLIICCYAESSYVAYEDYKFSIK